MPSQRDLLPRDKHDVDGAEALAKLGYPAVAPILPDLLTWFQDANWPVTQALIPFLASIGAPLAPHVRRALDGDDDVWKYFLLTGLVSRSQDLARELRGDLHRLADTPTEGERVEEVEIEAREILARLRE